MSARPSVRSDTQTLKTVREDGRFAICDAAPTFNRATLAGLRAVFACSGVTICGARPSGVIPNCPLASVRTQFVSLALVCLNGFAIAEPASSALTCPHDRGRMPESRLPKALGHPCVTAEVAWLHGSSGLQRIGEPYKFVVEIEGRPP